MIQRERILTVGGVGAVVGALLVVFGVVNVGGSSLLTSQGLLILLAIVTAVVGLWDVYGSMNKRPETAPFETAPESAETLEVDTTGARIDRYYGVLAGSEGDEFDYYYNKQKLRSELQKTARTVVAETADISNEEARERVEDGSWTDDVRAAAFLGSEATEPSLGVRLKDWFAGEVARRRADHAMAEIRRLAALPDDSAHEDGVVDRDDDSVLGGGVEAGELELTDTSIERETAVATADGETATTNHWEVGTLVAFTVSAVGFLLQNATLVLAAVVALTYAVYGTLTRSPEMNLRVRRTVDDGSPLPGEHVRVTVEVENVGNRPIAEVRLIDGVPSTLTVTEGTPRCCVSLKPGESASTTYTIEAARGDHAFDDVSLWVRNVSGTVERSCPAELSADLTCRDSLETVPTTRQTTPYQGRIDTDAAGEGLEFFATREYQHNDPLARIDWNYWAQTGDPRTVEFRESRSGTLVIVLDDRRISRKSRDEHSPDAVTLGRYAAVRMAETLLGESNAVGGALLARRMFERPGRGRDQSHRLRSFFDQSPEPEDGEQSESEDRSDGKWQPPGFRRTQPNSYDKWQGDQSSDSGLSRSLVYTPDGGGIDIGWLRKRLSGDEQVIFVTPLLDDGPKRALRTLQADGADVTVLSPDVTTTETPGRSIAGIERFERIRELRRGQFNVVDWPTDRPLSIALERAAQRRSR